MDSCREPERGRPYEAPSGEYVPIASYEVVLLDEPVAVYNFHVEDFECYYVSGQRVLVHNNNECGQGNTVKNILESAKAGNKTRGKSKIYEKSGGEAGANRDFNSLPLKDVKIIKNGRMGKLKDGRKVIVRKSTQDKRHTLEIQNATNKGRIKIRYDED